jgi:hypothetical protein
MNFDCLGMVERSSLGLRFARFHVIFQDLIQPSLAFALLIRRIGFTSPIRVSDSRLRVAER